MGSMTLVIILIVGAVVIAGMALVFINLILKPSAIRRLNKMVEEERKVYGEEPPSVAQASQLITQRLIPLARFSAPKDAAWDVSPLRRDLMAAGYRSESAGMIYLGLKTFLTFLFPIIFLVCTALFQWPLEPRQIGFVVIILAALGYMAPNFVLSALVSRRRQELFENFPDALDLMRICVEAGLALDAAIARVGEEMRIRSRALSDEFHLVVLEQRAGSTRNLALSNLAMRVGIEDVDALVATLVQADRFGTSISDSLRVHSENLRLGRRLRAEEKAAKIPTKILLPLILCIFPLLFILILSPAIANIKHALKGGGEVAGESQTAP